MYVYVKSMLRKKNSDETWQDVNISNMLLSTLFDNYASGYIKLTNRYLSKPVYLDLQEFKAMDIPTPDLTFNLWLTYIGDRTFATNEVEPTYKVGVVTFCDAWQAGYKIKRMGLQNDETENMVNADLPNLHISKSGVSVNALSNYAIPIVNGYMHFCEGYKNGIKVLDGAKAIDKSGHNQIGLLSFMDIGKIKLVRITERMLKATNNTTPMSRGLFIDTGIDLSKYKVLMSIGGFLHYGVGSFNVVNVSEGIIRVDVDSADIHEKLQIGMKDLDFNEGTMGISEHFPDSVVREKILSDSSLKHFFSHSTTFVILVETEVMGVERVMMDNVNLFSMFEYHVKPTLPMVDYLGRLPVYHFSQQVGKYVIRAVPQYTAFRNYNSTDGNYNRTNMVTAPTYYGKMVGHFLKISGHKRA